MATRYDKASKVASKALAAFDSAVAGLRSANDLLAAEVKEIDALAQYLTEQRAMAVTAQRQNDSVISKIEALTS